MDAAPLRTVVYGSCVTRDTFEYLRPRGYALLDYVARHSLVSAFSAVGTDAMGAVETSSSFQRRMLENDWRAGLVPLLEAKAAQVDVLLWDLCDERLGLRELGPGRVVTRSVDLLSTGLDARLEADSTTVDLGSPRHRELWGEALGRWRGVLDRLDLLDRLVLVAPPWATHAADGTPSPTSFGRTADAANPLFAEYGREAAAALGCPVVTLPGDLVRSDPGHQWGFAPFHYAESTYLALAAAVDDAVRALPGPTARPVGP